MVNLTMIDDPYDPSLPSKRPWVRVFHAAPNLPSDDVYITRADQELGMPSAASLHACGVWPPSGNNSKQLVSNSYRIRITPSGNKNK
jgi:hypothetical protein